MSVQNDNINPAVKATTIGVRELREIKVYPLSVGEQLKLGDVITDVVIKFVSELQDKPINKTTIASMENVEFVEFIIKLIQDNIKKIIEIATDEDPEALLGDITNDQFIDFAGLVFTMNFSGDVRKKLMGLVKKVMGTISVPEQVKKTPKKKKKTKKKEK